VLQCLAVCCSVLKCFLTQYTLSHTRTHTHTVVTNSRLLTHPHQFSNTYIPPCLCIQPAFATCALILYTHTFFYHARTQGRHELPPLLYICTRTPALTLYTQTFLVNTHITESSRTLYTHTFLYIHSHHRVVTNSRPYSICAHELPPLLHIHTRFSLHTQNTESSRTPASSHTPTT